MSPQALQISCEEGCHHIGIFNEAISCRSTSSISTRTPDTSSLQSPPFTPVCMSVVTATAVATSPPKHSVISRIPPPLSPQTQQLVMRNPQLAGYIAEQLQKTCLQLINNCDNQSPIQPIGTTTSHDPTSATTTVQEPVVTGATEVKSDCLIIPDSPPTSMDNTETSSLCESPPLFNSPVKQPLTSTQVNSGDVEMKELDSLSVGHEVEALHITETVKQEQSNTVVSLSSQDIVLPTNPASCDQTDSIVSSPANEGLPEQRHSLRKRNPTHKMAANVRHAKKRQHSVQPVR